jgi:aspartate ammonia-lyase
MSDTRTEVDSLGKREIPDTAYYGIQTLRATESFPVSGLRASRHLIRAYGLVKLACARANAQFGALDSERARAIEQAAEELAKGKFDDQLIVDVFQAGAGTSLHMNVNEVLANRALELLGKRRGAYDALSPNDQVNRSQSTNDTFPTAAQLAALFALAELRPALGALIASLLRKAEEFAHLPKAGRTHLKDAMPVTLGAELHAYATTLSQLLDSLPSVETGLSEVPLGGSAVGSGINSPPGFRAKAVAELGTLANLPIRVAQDPFAAMQSRWPLAAASAWLRNLAGELVRIGNDLRLLASGPGTGLDEVQLPEIVPGSSIMPAKVNPSQVECLTMIAFHVIGADAANSLAIQAGQLEINVMMPLSAYEVLFSAQILTNYLPVFARTCIDGMTANSGQLERFLTSSTALATILTPKLGYLKVAELVHESRASGVPIPELLVRQKLMTRTEVEAVLGPEALSKMAEPVP